MKQLLFIIELLISVVSLYAQTTTLCDSMLVPKDTTIIIGDTITLRGRGMFEYNWSSSFPNPNDSIQKVHPMHTTTYYLTGYYIDTNVVFNGNFDFGNKGFTSEYIHTTVRINEEYYAVGTNCHKFHESLPDIYDHTSGTGNYMIVNGSPARNKQVWSQIVPVHPNTNYVFITWVTSFCLPAADLQFCINGKQIGEIFHSPQKLGEWQQFYQVWNSGASTEAVITILNQNTVKQGNDFGLDDISFNALSPCEDSVTVHVIIPIEARNDTISACAGEMMTIYPTLNDSVNKLCSDIQLSIVTPLQTGDVSTHDDAITINFPPDINGTDSIVYSICCGDQCDTATIYLFISSDHVTFKDTICEGSSYQRYGFSLSSDQTINPGLLHLVDSAKNMSGCDSITELYLQVISQPHVEIIYNDDFCQGFMTTLECRTDDPVDDVLWSTGETGKTLTVTKSGLYSVLVRNGFCEASSQIVIPECEVEVYVPNAITASNEDNMNRYFGISCDNMSKIEQFEVNIFNRWGQLVFKSTDPNFKWEPQCNEEGIYDITPNNVYVYRMTYTIAGSKQKKLKGTIVVL